mmetsp:Transcript_14047/g.34788  ORF Transcript_14047/g.34788 Transcript_14047/m.34788 type:complete len:433 (-) Transcript_14047:438-1736(-)
MRARQTTWEAIFAWCLAVSMRPIGAAEAEASRRQEGRKLVQVALGPSGIDGDLSRIPDYAPEDVVAGSSAAEARQQEDSSSTSLQERAAVTSAHEEDSAVVKRSSARRVQQEHLRHDRTSARSRSTKQTTRKSQHPPRANSASIGGVGSSSDSTSIAISLFRFLTSSRRAVRRQLHNFQHPRRKPPPVRKNLLLHLAQVQEQLLQRRKQQREDHGPDRQKQVSSLASSSAMSTSSSKNDIVGFTSSEYCSFESLHDGEDCENACQSWFRICYGLGPDDEIGVVDHYGNQTVTDEAVLEHYCSDECLDEVTAFSGACPAGTLGQEIATSNEANYDASCTDYNDDQQLKYILIGVGIFVAVALLVGGVIAWKSHKGGQKEGAEGAGAAAGAEDWQAAAGGVTPPAGGGGWGQSGGGYGGYGGATAQYGGATPQY